MDCFASLAMTARECLPVLLLDERGKRIDILLQDLLQRFLRALTLVVEGIADAVQIDFGLAQDRTRDTRQDVLQMLGRADAAEGTGRVADNADRLSEKRALAVGARADVDGVL